MRLTPAFLASLALLVCLFGCGGTSIDGSESFDEGWKDANLAYLLTDRTRQTEAGEAIVLHRLIISDRTDLCADLEAGGLNQLDDVRALDLAVGTVGELKVGEAVVASQPLVGGNVQAGSVAMGLSAIQRGGGSPKLRAQATVSAAAPRVSLTVERAAEDGSPSRGALEAMLVADLADPSTFDADPDGDGTPDYRTLDELVTARFKDPERCNQ